MTGGLEIEEVTVGTENFVTAGFEVPFEDKTGAICYVFSEYRRNGVPTGLCSPSRRESGAR